MPSGISRPANRLLVRRHRQVSCGQDHWRRVHRGADAISGGSSKDKVYGDGSRDDTLIGGAGSGTVALEANGGKDIIVDFAAGADAIQVNTSAGSLDDLVDPFSSKGLKLDDDGSVLIRGLDPSDLSLDFRVFL